MLNINAKASMRNKHKQMVARINLTIPSPLEKKAFKDLQCLFTRLSMLIHFNNLQVLFFNLNALKEFRVGGMVYYVKDS